MKKTCLFLLMVLSATLAYSQKSKKEDIKTWNSDSLLTWDDFKGKPLKSVGNAAVTMSGIGMSFEEQGDELVATLQAIFDRQKSWVKEEEKMDYILNHEQMHFNISELFARKFRKDLQGRADKNKVGNLQELIMKLREKYMEDLNKYQDKYDTETNHGLNITKQKEWNDTISLQLEELKNYETQDVRIALK